MWAKKNYDAVVKFPDGSREVFKVQASTEWDARYALPDSVKDRNGEFLYAVEEKHGDLIEKLNQLREKRVEKRLLGHSVFVERITPGDGEIYATLPSGRVYEVYRHPEDQEKIIIDGKYVADKDHFYHLSCSAN